MELYLGFPAPADELPLDGHLTLAIWNRSMTLLLEELQTQVWSPRDLEPEEARKARRECAEFDSHLSRAVSALDEIDRLLPKLAEIPGGRAIEKCMELVDRFVTATELQAGWLQGEVNSGVDFPTCVRACAAAVERGKIAVALEEDDNVKSLLGEDFAGIDTDITAALAALSFGESIDNYGLGAPLKARLRSGHPLEVAKLVVPALERVSTGLRNVSEL